ncbi:MAG: glycerophosphodiester phosphodiesterase family protein [Gammaproteobacteria bacterium]|nr:glycerophosphodiester phosphodiesterase family protein [Gammaproteobacteria bacterium]
MNKPTSIRAWAAWPSTAQVPLGHSPIIPVSNRPTNGASRTIVMGHRAARGLAPENTLSAVREALAAGVDWIEIDVWHVDGELVVIHDQRVDRTTNGMGYVQDFSLHDLRMLDAGNCQRVPLLEEVIELIDGRCGLNIELKGPDCADAAVDAVNAALRTKRWYREQFLLSSFDHAQLARVKELDRRIRTGLLLCGAPYDLASYAQQLDVWSVHFSLNFVRAEWVSAVQNVGLWAFVYTVNEPQDAARLREINVDGIFTDYPVEALATANAFNTADAA